MNHFQLDHRTPPPERWTPAPFRGLGAAYREVCERLMSVAGRVLSPADAEDAVHDAMVSCLNRLRSGEPMPESAELEAGLTKQVLDRARANRRRLARRAQFADLVAEPRDALVRLMDPAHSSDAADVRREVNRVLEAMPRRWAQAFLFRMDHTLSYEAIARLMHITPAAARSYFAKACLRLNRELTRVGITPAAGRKR